MNSSKTVALVLVGLLSAIWRQYILTTSPPTLQQEAWTGWLTWALLYAGCRLHTWKRRASLDPSEATGQPHDGFWSRHLKIFGLSATGVVAQIAQSRGTFPFVTPLVTLATLLVNVAAPPDKDAAHVLELAQPINEQGFQKPSVLDKTFSPLRIPSGIPVNLVLFLLLAGSISYQHSLISVTVANSILFLLARTATFTLLPRMSQINNSRLPNIDITVHWNLLERLSLSSLASFTCLLAFSTPASFVPSLVILLCAATEAAWWFTVLFLNAERLSTTATTLEIVATSFDLSMSREQKLKALLASMSAVGALWESVTSIPLNHQHRNWLYLLILIPLFGRLSHNGYYQSMESQKQNGYIGMHPVDSIVLQARIGFSVLLDRQSKTLEQATREYVRRYGRQPPPYFDRWFDLTQQHDFALVDEFDTVMQSLEPFWGVPPSTHQTLSSNVLAKFPNHLIKYEILDHRTMVTQGNQAGWFRDSIADWLPEEWGGLLPNMTLAINIFDEPSVCVPRDALEKAMQLARSKGSHQRLIQAAAEQDLSRSPRFLDVGKQDAWEAMTLSCLVQSPARNPICTPSTAEEPLSFIRNLTQSRDICEHCELQNLEGFLLAPETLRLTHSFVPIWSQAKTSSFNDIIFPSPYYMVRSDDYLEKEDPDWESKDNQLYWVGAATGGHATESNWKQMQRQRMTLMTQAGSNHQIQLLFEAEPGLWIPYTTNMSDVSSLFSTRVMGVTPQCEHAACEAQKQAFEVGDQEVKDPISAAYAHKFLLDMDGNGFSGRYYRLLRSKSVVMKQAMFQEWHDDRLIPWVHYIPVSTSFEELPELVRFLATTEKGEAIAARIAQESRDWVGKVLRDVDLQLVWLRMLMEFGRITDPTREL